MTHPDPEGHFVPDQSNILSEPMVCPHCGRSMPREPDVLRTDDRVHESHRNQARARYVPTDFRVEVWGGDSGFSEADPFTIDADRVATPRDVARWMARIAGKSWAWSESFFDDLGEALCLALTHSTARHQEASA